MEISEILSKCDHTLLTQTATWADIKGICDDGMKYHTASVCIPASFVRQAKEYVGERLPICTVIGFPNGYDTTAAKCFMASDAVDNGADEVDMVINIGWAKEGKWEDITREIAAIKNACKGKILKVIIETCLLTDEEKIALCKCVSDSGADFIKTSTGFSKAGATFHDVELFAANVAPHVKIKAAGGISSLNDAEEFIRLGASRLGTSRIVKLAKAKERFLEAIRQTVKANEAWVPPYGSGASLYLRPYMFGIDPIIGVKPATEFQFRVFGTPVGPYFKGGIKPLTIRVSDLDRAAPRGTGHIKAGLNYAMSLYNIVDAHEQGYDENLYVDSATRTHIEETGGANILFVTKEGKLVVPKSATILPSITRRSLIQVARDYLHLEVEERVVGIDELGDFAEAGLCGTAAVISPIGKIVDHGKEYTYAGMGNVVEKLYKTLTGIQMGTIEAPEGWIMVID